VCAVKLTPAERRRAHEFTLLVADEPAATSPDGEPGSGGAHRRHRRNVQADRADLTDLVGLTDRLRTVGDGVVPDPDFARHLRERLVAVASVRRIDAETSPRAAADRTRTRTRTGASGSTRSSGRREKFATHPRLRARPAIPLRGLVAATEPDQASDQATLRAGLPNRVPRRVTLISGTLIGLVALSGVSVASGGANPGDALYGVKRSREAAQLALVRNPEASGQLRLQLATRRLAEAAVAVTNPARIRKLLDEMDTDTRTGVADLARAALNESSSDPLDTVDRFALAQDRGLNAIHADGPTEVRLGRSRALLLRIEERSSDLRGTLLCGGTLTGPNGRDDLGPRPRTCSALSRPESGPGGLASRPTTAPSRYPQTDSSTATGKSTTDTYVPSDTKPDGSPPALASTHAATQSDDPSTGVPSVAPVRERRGTRRTTRAPGTTSATTQQDTGSLLGSVPDTAGDVLGGVLDPLTETPPSG
jgi:hypothetical protein